MLFLVFVSLFVSLLIIGRSIGSKENLREVSLTQSFNKLCEDCRSRANVPACSFVCDLNAIHVPNDTLLPGLSGTYILKHHNIRPMLLWVLELQCNSDGSVLGFSVIRRGINYQSYHVSGVYAGAGTLLLLLSSTDRTGEPVAPNLVDLPSLSTSADPEAVGLKLKVVAGSLLHGSTTGQTALDGGSPIEVSFEKTVEVPDDYFSATDAP